MQGKDLFLDGVLGHQPIDGDRPLLAHAVGAVAGLVLHRRVPPGVEVDHIVGGGQVEPAASRLEADQEQIAASGLEGLDALLALLRSCRAVQVLVRDALPLQPGAHDLQVIDELAEDQGPVAAFPQLFDDLGEGLQLAPRQRAAGHRQRRMAAEAAQTGDLGQHLEGTGSVRRDLLDSVQRLLA
ncbi:hypothetical protein D3C85_1366590 [compost metagenome]